MGALLECVDDPGAMLDRGLSYLRPGGRLIVTTPFGVHPHIGYRKILCLTEVIDLLRPRVRLELLSVVDNHIRFIGRLSNDREASWQSLDAEAVLSMTNAALVASQTKLYEMLERRETQIERLQHRLRQRAEADRAGTGRLQRKVNSSYVKIKRFEFRVKLGQIALTHSREDVEARTKELEARTKELEARTREIRMLSHRLQATRSSTSFLVGSALVRAAKRPLTLWKLPLQLLRLYRSKSTPQVEAVVSEESTTPHSHVPKEHWLVPKSLMWTPPASSTSLLCPCRRLGPTALRWQPFSTRSPNTLFNMRRTFC